MQFNKGQVPRGVSAAAESLATKLQEKDMQDVLFTRVQPLDFFALSIAYVHFCDRIR